jgi:hypothetical protein
MSVGPLLSRQEGVYSDEDRTESFWSQQGIAIPRSWALAIVTATDPPSMGHGLPCRKIWKRVDRSSYREQLAGG